MKYRLGDFVVNNWNDWDRVPRDPVSIGVALGASSTTLFGGAVIFGVSTAAVVGFLVTTAVTSWALSALAPKPKFGASTNSGGILVNARDAAAPQDFVYGEVRKGGVITYASTTGTANKYLHQIIVLAGHELTSIGDIYLNDEVATLSGDYVTTVGDIDYESKILIKKFTGAAGQDVGTTLASLPDNQPVLAPNFRGDGIACLYVRYEYDQEKYPSGLPIITAKVQGKKVYDPRTSTTDYSNNAALCIRDFLTSSYGLSDTNIDDTLFSAAANECDEDVTLSGGGTEKRYTVNGIVNASTATGDVLQELTTACAGTLFWGTGSWKLKVGVYSPPVKNFGLDDLRGPISLATRITARDNFNSVSGTFIDQSQDYITADYPAITSAIFLQKDANQENKLDLPLPYTTSASAAQRLAKLTLLRGREQMTLSAEFGLRALEVEVGDIVTFTNERYGFSAKEFEVVGWRLSANQDAGDLRVNLTLRETSETAFDWNAEEILIERNNTTLLSAFDVPSVTLNDPTSSTVLNSDGTSIQSIDFSWTPEDASRIDYYVFEWSDDSGVTYNPTTTTGTTFRLSPVLSGVTYVYRVTAYNYLGAKGTTVTSGIGVAGLADDTIPNAPTSPSAVGGYRTATVTWVEPTTNTDASDLTDLKYYRIYRDTTTDPTTEVGVTFSNIFTDGGLVDGTTYYYRVTAVDRTNNESAFSTNAVVTTEAELTAGSNAKQIALTADGQSFTYDGLGAADPTSQTITFTANLQYTDDTVATFTTSPNVTLTGTGNTRSLSVLNFGTNTSVSVTASADSGAVSDTFTVYRLQQGIDGNNGENAITLILSNESHLLSAAEDGTVASYTGSGTDVRVYDGTTELQYDSVGTSNGTYDAIVTAVGITSGTKTQVLAGGYLRILDHSNMTADDATVSINIQGTRLDGTTFSFTKVQSLSKSKQGVTGADGADGVIGADGADGPRGAGRWNIGISAIPAGSFSVGTKYWITTLGTTDFTLIGAASNTLGESFIATGVGSGTGTATPLPATSLTANAEFISALFDPVDYDQAWFYAGNVGSPVAQSVWIYDASSATWQEQQEVINGNLIVSGSITSQSLRATTLSGLFVDAGEITAGVLRSSDGNFVIDLDNKFITITV